MIRKLVPFAIAIALVYAMWLLPAWDQAVERVPPDTKAGSGRTGALPADHPPIESSGLPADRPPVASPGLPPDHPPIPAGGGAGTASMSGAPMATPQAAAKPNGATDASALPLDEAQTTELRRALEALPSGESRELFETAFRSTFTTAKDGRNYALAKANFEKILAKAPKHAPSYRGLAYVEFNTTMNAPATITLYEKALELDPNYGEAHYAMAFMLGTNDPARGETYFRRAMELGVADGRKLRERFYPGVR